jgi:predicted phosphodiesterase
MQSKAAIAREYVLRHEDDLREGRLNKAQLAKQLVKDHPGLWDSVEHARYSVRSVTCAGTSNTTVAFEMPSTIAHGLQAVKSYAKQPDDYEISGPARILVVSDLHIPYHDGTAMQAAFEYAKSQGIEDVYVNGDLVDFYQLSRFDRDPNVVGIQEELRILGEFLSWLRENFSGRLWWKLGNHEDRFDRYMIAKAPELYGLPALSVAGLVGADDYGIEMVGSRTLTRMGKLNVVHGHEFGESIFSPVNPARGLFLRAKCSTIAGHHHATSEHHENNLNGDGMACWSVGCLCDLRPSYRPFAFTRWNHGFAIIELDADGAFVVRNHRIIDGVVH